MTERSIYCIESQGNTNHKERTMNFENEKNSAFWDDEADDFENFELDENGEIDNADTVNYIDPPETKENDESWDDLDFAMFDV